MRIYTERPKPKRARLAWDYATKQRGKEPLKLWKNANCWQKNLSVCGNAWGWWIAEFDRGTEAHTKFEPINPAELKEPST